jgi:2-polyprenyl-3-methyl-5-hydroxy-6-metoxy-1,4-benzoquinol methylase
VLKLPPLDARIPKWNFDDLNERSCPICRTLVVNIDYERPDGLYIRKCKKCCTYFVSPTPSDNQLQAFYEHYDETHGRLERINKKKLAASYKYLNPFADLRIRKLFSLMKFESSRVLDIGLGRASFLYSLKKLGAIPFGLDLDNEAIEIANYLGINVFQGNINDFISEDKYDLITLLDFIEHPINPIDSIRSSVELLKDRGLLAIWTPNGNFASFEKNPTTFRVDLEHMQYFTPETCIFIASELKLRIVHLETLGFPSLIGIDKPICKNKSTLHSIKRIIRSMPWFTIINNIRYKLFIKKQDERIGSYHLFCIMQKPSL